MRILIGNHIDDSIRLRNDMRAWTQRVLWFARNGDLLILPDHPDEQFLHYATALTGVDPDTLRFHVPPQGRFNHRLFDARSLTDPKFLEEITTSSNKVSEVFALWPSAHVAQFTMALGLSDRLPGANFFSQGGGELVNNKTCFRALATGCGVPIADGAVCHNAIEAVDAMARLLNGTGAVVVKQAHNGAGVGNQIVIRREGLDAGHVGARHIYHLGLGKEEIEAYWRQRWDWASAGGRFSVVIEEFQPEATSLYSEYYVDDTGVTPTEAGILFYVHRRLSHQIVPLRNVHVDEGTREQLVALGAQLAEIYRKVGYRGYLSADAVLDRNRQVLFTEVNAQVSGSLHIYDVIAHQIVNTSVQPERSVVEYHVPPTWRVADFDDFLNVARQLGCLYDPGNRTGIIVSMPVIPLEINRAQFVFCIAYDTEIKRQKTFQQLDDHFARIPASTIGPEAVGLGNTLTQEQGENV